MARSLLVSGRLFVNRLNLIEIDIVEQHIVDAIVTIGRVSKRPDSESIFKFTLINNASNFTMSDLEAVLDELKQKGDFENKQRKGDQI